MPMVQCHSAERPLLVRAPDCASRFPVRDVVPSDYAGCCLGGGRSLRAARVQTSCLLHRWNRTCTSILAAVELGYDALVFLGLTYCRFPVFGHG